MSLQLITIFELEKEPRGAANPKTEIGGLLHVLTYGCPLLRSAASLCEISHGTCDPHHNFNQKR
jgi:hypothetical protein